MLKIGTRGSPLALAQAHHVKESLKNISGEKDDFFEIVIIQTSGDKFLNKNLKDLGGKGLFTKEIEEALLCGDIHLAVHSMKDVPTGSQQGLQIIAVPPREDVRDVFISEKYQSLAELPLYAHIGTASLRREARLRHLRPDLKISLLRGNVQTRLRKVQEGFYDATLLALAGLNRLGCPHLAKEIFDIHTFLPAPAQGAIGIEVADNLAEVFKTMIMQINCLNTMAQITAERAFLKALDGNCRTPIATFAEIKDDNITLTGQLLSTDGKKIVTETRTDSVPNAEKLGLELGIYVKHKFEMR